MNAVFLFLLLVTPQLAAGGSLAAFLFPPRLIPVTLTIDFGPAGKPKIEKEIQVREGTPPKEALEKICKVEDGKVCCHPGEVKGIDGVAIDPLQDLWWRLEINGEGRAASPHKSRLKAGDRVAWIYYHGFYHPRD